VKAVFDHKGQEVNPPSLTPLPKPRACADHPLDLLIIHPTPDLLPPIIPPPPPLDTMHIKHTLPK
jgi:hypothetical protein